MLKCEESRSSESEGKQGNRGIEECERLNSASEGNQAVRKSASEHSSAEVQGIEECRRKHKRLSSGRIEE